MCYFKGKRDSNLLMFTVTINMLKIKSVFRLRVYSTWFDSEFSLFPTAKILSVRDNENSGLT